MTARLLLSCRHFACNSWHPLSLVVQDEDEEQGTLKFGKQKEQSSYGGMDEEEKAIWKVMAQQRVAAVDKIPYK